MTRPGAAAAGAWSAIDVVLRQAVQFLVSVILARLLAPEDFGVIALMAFFTSVSIVFIQGGLSVALIQRQATSHEEESAIFWWNLVGSILFGLAIIAAGPAIAAFFGYPVLRPLAYLAAAQLVFSAIGAVHTALLTREMRMDLLAKSGVLAAATSGAIGIAAALMGMGVWALALQATAFALLSSLSLWVFSSWRPSMHFRFGTIRGLFGFGAWVSIGSVMDALYMHGFVLLIGKLHGARELGFYNRASATQSLPGTALGTIIGRVSLSLIASKQHDLEAVKRSLAMGIACVMLLNVPIMAGIALLSGEIVVVLFGSRWLPAAPILAILALGGVLYPLHVVNLQLVLARGQSRTFMRNEVIKKSLGLGCVIIGSLFGVVGLAWSQVVYAVLGFLVNAQPARRDLGYGALSQLWDIAGIMIAALVMAAGVYALKTALGMEPLATLAVCVFCGAVLYAAVGWFAGFRAFREPAAFLVREYLGSRYARH